ncbi:hypothetical protein ATCC90586_003180 [Pythium insidiosum]|nr:hypothetical protein ATCC90586_003180 [Pythium insidiosum]
MKVFVTVGTTKFDALIQTLDSEACMRALHARGATTVRMQIGHGEHVPSSSMAAVPGLKIEHYRHDPQYKRDVEQADLIISHAGAGSIMDALSARKKLLVVVNTALMDNHQTELAEAMAEQRYCVQTTCEGLLDALQHADFESLQSYPEPDEDAFPALIDQVVRRPYLASECDSLKDAERWRRQIIREISKKVSDIQNAGLGEHVIRDLNDEINKRIREKYHWEKRIAELGGPDYTRSQPPAYDADGVAAAQTGGGYKYFGAAKNLPGVRELFETEEYVPKRRSRDDMLKHIEPDYYGLRDEDEDPSLVEEEREAERRLQAQANEEWDRAQKERDAQLAALGVSASST